MHQCVSFLCNILTITHITLVYFSCSETNSSLCYPPKRGNMMNCIFLSSRWWSPCGSLRCAQGLRGRCFWCWPVWCDVLPNRRGPLSNRQQQTFSNTSQTCVGEQQARTDRRAALIQKLLLNHHFRAVRRTNSHVSLSASICQAKESLKG